METLQNMCGKQTFKKKNVSKGYNPDKNHSTITQTKSISKFVWHGYIVNIVNQQIEAKQKKELKT